MAVKRGRLRYFGGTSNHWTGMCGVFDDSDFQPKRYHDLPGWPIARKDILAHQSVAAQILELPTTDLSARAFGTPAWSTFEQRTTAQSPPTRFGIKYRAEIVASNNIDLYLHANVVDVRTKSTTGPLHHVDHLVVSNYRKEQAQVVAKRYVIAMGTIENARLLLHAGRDVPQGLGNQSGFVGQCFMEHLNVQIGRYVAGSNTPIIASGIGLGPTDATLHHFNIGNGILSLSTSAEPQEYGRLAPVRRLLRKSVCQSETVRDFSRKFQDFNCAGDGVISTLIEQAPDRRNRVTLSNERDEFGLQRPHLHWTLSDADKQTIRTLGLELARSFVHYNVGRVQLSDFVLDPQKEIPVWPHAHQMGTTRMSLLPEHGVTDSHCRLHNVSNLYVAGSSVFPTGGGINPTLTIVMLALRLARHLTHV